MEETYKGLHIVYNENGTFENRYKKFSIRDNSGSVEYYATSLSAARSYIDKLEKVENPYSSLKIPVLVDMSYYDKIKAENATIVNITENNCVWVSNGRGRREIARCRLGKIILDTPENRKLIEEINSEFDAILAARDKLREKRGKLVLDIDTLKAQIDAKLL